METNSDNCNKLSEETLNEETVEALQELLPSLKNLGGMENISSVAFFTNKNNVYVFKSGTVEQHAVSLTLAVDDIELVDYYTTYDDTKCPVRCCANRVTCINGVIVSHEELLGDADSVYMYKDKYYYFSYNPNKPENERCCVYNAEQVLEDVDNEKRLVWKPIGSALFCGK